MVRRWLIRLPFLLALAFVVTVWVTSWFGMLQWGHWYSGREGEVHVARGLIVMSEEPWASPGYQVSLCFRSFRYEIDNSWLPSTTLGFHVGRYRNAVNHSFEIAFPLWLPTLLLLALNWLVWRKTRPKMAGRAFPVEPAAKSGELKP